MRVAALAAALLIGTGAGAIALAQEEPPPPEPLTPTATAPAPEPPLEETSPEFEEPEIEWFASRSLGRPWAGRLVDGVQLPAEGPSWFTWDPVLKTSPDRPWRRYGSDSLLRTLLSVLREFSAAHPEAPRIGVGDLSRPEGGAFGKRYGGRGHASHQNGLDADVYYPRQDGLERAPARPAQVDRVLAQELVDRFVDAGAEKVFVGPRLGLRGPKGVVVPLIYHDDHLHVRIPPPPE